MTVRLVPVTARGDRTRRTDRLIHFRPVAGRWLRMPEEIRQSGYKVFRRSPVNHDGTTQLGPTQGLSCEAMTQGGVPRGASIDKGATLHIKTGLVVGFLFGAVVLSGCASSTPATAHVTKATVKATATPSPSPSLVALNPGSGGKALAAKQAVLAKQAVVAKQAGAKKIVVAAVGGVDRNAPAIYGVRLPRYMLAAANSQ